MRVERLSGGRAGQLRQLHPLEEPAHRRPGQGLSDLARDPRALRNLAIGQKNTVELAGDRDAVGLDCAVAEECGEWDECGDYVDAFGNNVIVIEYTDEGMDTACGGFADTLSIVQRDVDVSVPGDSGYVRKTC